MGALLISPAHAQTGNDTSPPPDQQIQGAATRIVTPMPNADVATRPVPRSADPEVKALRKDDNDTVAARAREVSDSCDTPIKARIDWSRIDAREIDANSPSNACTAALDAIEETCTNDRGKELVAADIRNVICTAGPQPSLSLHAGTLVYTVDWQSRNPGAAVYQWLAAHL